MRVCLHEKPNLLCVATSNAKVKEWLFALKPFTSRYYDEEIRAWVVPLDRLHDVVRIGLYYAGQVDYSLLPLELQMGIAAEKAAWRTRAKLAPVVESTEEPYSVMHLLPTAPKAIVDAAWKALARLHHPDMGGDEEQFKRISAAYEKIKNS